MENNKGKKCVSFGTDQIVEALSPPSEEAREQVWHVDEGGQSDWDRMGRSVMEIGNEVVAGWWQAFRS